MNGMQKIVEALEAAKDPTKAGACMNVDAAITQALTFARRLAEEHKKTEQRLAHALFVNGGLRKLVGNADLSQMNDPSAVCLINQLRAYLASYDGSAPTQPAAPVADMSDSTVKDSLTTQTAPQPAAPVAEPEPYNIDQDPQGIRALVCDAIRGAVGFGFLNSNPPPEGHWLGEFWRMAQISAQESPQPAAPVAQDEEYTYASKQQTTCAGCGNRKHTPLRIDAMGGYVCLSCIDQKLGSLLGELGYAQPAAPLPEFSDQPTEHDKRSRSLLGLGVHPDIKAARHYVHSIPRDMNEGVRWSHEETFLAGMTYANQATAELHDRVRVLEDVLRKCKTAALPTEVRDLVNAALAARSNT